MHERPDLRVRRTHTLLREALIDLIAEKGFDAVTVRDIAERAKVNRATFYRHYQDKYALVTGIFQEAVDRVVSELGPPAENIEALDWINELGASPEQPVSFDMQHAVTAWATFLEHFAKHARLYQAMLGKHGSSWFTTQMRSYVAEVLRKRLLASHLLVWRKTDDPNTMPVEVAIMCLANWFVGMLTWWLENGTVYTPLQMAIWSLRFITHGYYSALGINVSRKFEAE